MTKVIYKELTDSGLTQEIIDCEDRILRAIDNSNLGTAGQEVSLIFGLDMELMNRFKTVKKMYTALLEKKSENEYKTCTRCYAETTWKTLDINGEALCKQCGIKK